MCGICGKVAYDNRDIEEDLLRDMCASFSYRGPDDKGIYLKKPEKGNNKEIGVGLGHTRLSIIDLSSAGQQPMSNEDGSLWVVYNGEIYNFKELKEYLEKRGHKFKSLTDTEVILHLYEEEGIDCVKRFNGMFAFAVWDERKTSLFVCRDRIGIKPLIYYWDGTQFAFASEIKALLCDPSIPRDLDYEALGLYLTFNYVPSPHTIFKGIRKLDPGHSILLKDGKLNIRRYWDIPMSVAGDADSLPITNQAELYQKEIYESVSDAVKKRLIADVPLGAFLSGGIDSSIVVGFMAQHSKEPIKTFSIGFKDMKLFDETDYSRKVADHFKTDHHEFRLTYRDILDVFPRVLSTFDEPFADSSAIPTYIVSRETKKHVTVALSGDGGDELFAGYRSYLGEYWYKRYMYIPALLRKGIIEPLVMGLPDSRDVKFMEYIRRMKKFMRGTNGSFAERVLSLKEIFPRDIRERLLMSVGDGSTPQLNDLALKMIQMDLESYEGDRLNSILYLDVKNSLPGDMLNKVDWMSMNNSLEVRVPLLDHNVVELAFRIAGTLKLRKGRTKYLLKETFKDLLPASLYRRPKAGFEIPISRWLKTDLRFLLEQYLEEARIRRQGIFNYEVIKSLIEDFMRMKTDTSWMLWNLIVFEYWYETYFE